MSGRRKGRLVGIGGEQSVASDVEDTFGKTFDEACVPTNFCADS